MGRIKSSMDLLEMIEAVSGGTPGTIAVISGILQDFHKLDPENLLDLPGYLFIMDTFGIYDGNLWNIHSRLCEMEIVKTIAILRGLQLGILSSDQLERILKSKVETINFSVLITQIRSKLGRFAEKFDV